MFLEHYGLNEQPFGVTPDPRYLYFGATHREALASLYYGIETGCGFMTLIAPPGMGKTTLLLHLLERVRSTAQTVFLFQTQCGSREFLRCLLTDLGVDAREQNLAHMYESLNSVLLSNARMGRRFVLVIDEAQNLEHSVLETVRLLSDFETQSAKLMQIVLSGQPQLADKLSDPSLLQLRQRISIVSRLQPFALGGTVLYIDNRLHVAGYSGPPLFTFEAIARIADHSGGIPRNINNICFNALTLGFAKGLKQIDASIVREVLADLDMDRLGSEGMTAGLASSDSSFSADGLGPTDELSYQEFHAAQRAARATAESQPGEGAAPAGPNLTSPEPSLDDLKTTQNQDEARAPFISVHPAAAVALPTATGPDPVLIPIGSQVALEPAVLATCGTKTAVTREIETRADAMEAPNRGGGTDFEEAPPARAWSAPAMVESRGGTLGADSTSSIVSGVPKTEELEQTSIAAKSARQTSPAESRSPRPAARHRSGSTESGKSFGTPPAPGIGPLRAKHTARPKHWTFFAARAGVLFVLIGVGVLFVYRNLRVARAVSSIPAVETEAMKDPIPELTTQHQPSAPLARSSPAFRSGPAAEPNARPVSAKAPTAAPSGTRPHLEAAEVQSNEPDARQEIASPPNGRENRPRNDGQHVGRLKEPRLLSGAAPEYPFDARQEHVEGDVLVKIVVDQSGNISDMKAVSGPIVLRQAALDALQSWKYEPPMSDGQPIAVEAMVTIRFRL
jgi:general secretion pathway protein A